MRPSSAFTETGRKTLSFSLLDKALMEFHCYLPLGYLTGKFGPTQQKPTAETTYYDEWDSPSPRASP